MSRRLVLLAVLSILVPILVHDTGGVAHASGAHAAQTVTLTVDATEAPRKLFRAREVIPVSPGPLRSNRGPARPEDTARHPAADRRPPPGPSAGVAAHHYEGSPGLSRP
jgi:hypothetical protein